LVLLVKRVPQRRSEVACLGAVRRMIAGTLIAVPTLNHPGAKRLRRSLLRHPSTEGNFYYAFTSNVLRYEHIHTGMKALL
jgi:hypothetical protein